MPEVYNSFSDAQKDLDDLLNFSARCLFSFNVIENYLFEINMRILKNWRMASSLLEGIRGIDERINLTTNLIKTGKHSRNIDAWIEIIKSINKSKQIRNIIAHSHHSVTYIDGKLSNVLSEIRHNYIINLEYITSLKHYDDFYADKSKKKSETRLIYTASFLKDALHRIGATEHLVSEFSSLTDLTDKQISGSDTPERRNYFWQADEKRKKIMYLATGDEDPERTKREQEFLRWKKMAMREAQDSGDKNNQN